MLRLMVFHDRPDCMAVFVHDYDGPQTLVVDYPLTRARVLEAARAAGVEVRISEAAYVGRLKPVFDRMLAAQRTARHQEQREREAALALSLDAPERTRGQLLEEKHKVDDELRQLKRELGVIKSRAFERRTYPPASELRKKEDRIAALKKRSLAIQFELGQLRLLPRPAPAASAPRDPSQVLQKRAARIARAPYTEQLLYHVGRLIEERLGRAESEEIFKNAREQITQPPDMEGGL
jgi:hypothetical protein